MRKKKDYKELSTKRCKVCNTKLKQNLVDKIPNADLCYKHYQRDVKKNPRYIKKAVVLFIAFCIFLTSCGIQKPQYVMKQNKYIVTEVKNFTAKCEGNGQVLTVRNFDLVKGDTLIQLYLIPVIK